MKVLILTAIVVVAAPFVAAFFWVLLCVTMYTASEIIAAVRGGR